MRQHDRNLDPAAGPQDLQRHVIAVTANPKIDVRSGLEAWRGPPDPSSPIPSDNHDGDANGPRSLDEVIFD